MPKFELWSTDDVGAYENLNIAKGAYETIELLPLENTKKRIVDVGWSINDPQKLGQVYLVEKRILKLPDGRMGYKLTFQNVSNTTPVSLILEITAQTFVGTIEINT